jgi:hypothetical protein
LNEKIASIEDKKKDGSHLENRFVLCQGARRDNDALRNRNASQACNGNLPPHNDNDHPDRNFSGWNERDESCDDQKLVRKGIQKFPQGGLDPKTSCEIPVERIRHGGSKKEQRREQLISPTDAKKENEDKRNRQNPEDGYSIGQAQYLLAIEFFHEETVPADTSLLEIKLKGKHQITNNSQQPKLEALMRVGH